MLIPITLHFAILIEKTKIDLSKKNACTNLPFCKWHFIEQALSKYNVRL